MLVSESYVWENQCVDVEVDFQKFYLKFAEQDTENRVTKSCGKDKLIITVRTVYHSWRNRIDYLVTKLKKGVKCWDTILHNRIADYFNIYTQILNFGTQMLVAHRDMISIHNEKGF